MGSAESPNSGYTGGDVTPGNTCCCADGVGSISDGANKAGETYKEPDNHQADGLALKSEFRGGIKLSLHPDISEQAVYDAGHSAE